MAEVIGAIGGAVGEILGKERQNYLNRQSQEDVQSFQEWMFRHRYQMQMADMERAGLNPMLSAGAAPPGPPSGAGGTTVSAPDITGAVTSALSTAQQVKRTENELKTGEAEREVLSTEAARNLANTVKLSEEARKIKHETGSASAKEWQDKRDVERRKEVGPKSALTDLSETLSVTLGGLLKKWGVLSETPKREAEREQRKTPYGDNSRGGGY